MPPKRPKDPFPYPQHPESRPISKETPPGCYVYAQDVAEEIFVVRDTNSHLHCKILGEGRPALYAGDLTLEPGGVIRDLTNLSGTFGFQGKGGLLRVAFLLRQRGLLVSDGAVRWFPPDGSSRPLNLE